MSTTTQILIAYGERVAPAVLLVVATGWLLRREPLLRIVLYLLSFVLLRDAMTPLGLWAFGREGWFWIRLPADTGFLILFGFACLAASLGLYFGDRANRALVTWWRGSTPQGVLLGIVGAAIVVLPLALIYRGTDVHFRGGNGPQMPVLATLVFALLGNLLEELLFRGYVLGYLAQQMTRVRAGLASALIFALGHTFLATTVTNAGYPLLLFTLWEGAIAGLVAARHGVIASTITHGGAIFLLASGWL